MSNCVRRSLVYTGRDYGIKMASRCQKQCPRTCRKVAYQATVLSTKQDPDIIEDYLINQGFTDATQRQRQGLVTLIAKGPD